MQGNRRDDNTYPYQLQPGEYAKANVQETDGTDHIYWWIKTPNGIDGCLRNHKCIEEADGTLTVPPPGPGEGANSILCREFMDSVDPHKVTKSWHGFMDHGFWKEC